MDTYALAVQQLKKAIENAIEKAISNGELPQAETAPFIIETPCRQKPRRLCNKCGNGRRKGIPYAAFQNCTGYHIKP